MHDFSLWHERHPVEERILNESLRGWFAEVLEHIGLTVEKHANLGSH